MNIEDLVTEDGFENTSTETIAEDRQDSISSEQITAIDTNIVIVIFCIGVVCGVLLGGQLWSRIKGAV